MTYGNQLEFRSLAHNISSEYGMSDTHFDTQVCMKITAINQNKKKNNNTNTKKERNKLRCDQFEIASLSHMILR